MGEGGDREFGLGPDSGYNWKPPNEIKLIKKKKKDLPKVLSWLAGLQVPLPHEAALKHDEA